MKSNKFLILLLIFFSVLTVFLGYSQLKKAIYSPFKQTIVKEPEFLDQAEVFTILSEQDTDNDGLSDFDEKFVYQTSVYLYDSDGDSFSDKEEVDAKSDPLNPKSTPYYTPAEQEFIQEQVFSSPESDLSEQGILIQEIRNLLINQGGLSKEVVDKLDDKTLENLYNETKQETGIDLEQLQAVEQFNELDIFQIRQFLVEQGLDSEMLDSIDDETLKSMFLQLFTATEE